MSDGPVVPVDPAVAAEASETPKPAVFDRRLVAVRPDGIRQIFSRQSITFPDGELCGITCDVFKGVHVPSVVKDRYIEFELDETAGKGKKDKKA